jgi:PAS domain S-box-containing protein
MDRMTPPTVDTSLLQGVLDSSPSGIMAFRAVRGPGGEIADFEWELCNAAAERMVGRPAAELVGKRLLVEMPGNLEDGLFDRYVEVVESGEELHLEHYYEHEKVRTWFETCAVRHGDGFVVTFSDITPRKRVEEEKDRFLDLSVDLICIARTDGYFEYVSPSFETVLGYSREELLARPFLDFIHPDDHAKNDAEVESLADGEATTDFENHYIHKDGSVLTFSWTASPLEEEGLMYCIGRDVTLRNKLDEALRREHGFVNAVIDRTGALVLVMDPEGRIVRFNAACETASGWTSREAVGRFVWDFLLPPEDVEAVKEVFGGLAAGMFPNRHRNPWVTRTGDKRLLEWSNTAIVDGSGQVEYVVGTALDVTEQSKAEESLAAERELLAVTLRSIGDAVITTDLEGRVAVVNRVAEELTGWTQEEAADRPLSEVFKIIHQTTRQPCEDPVSKVLSSGQTVGLANHTVLISRDGTERILSDSAAAIRDRESRIRGVVLVFRDVTEEYRRDAEMRKAQKLESVGLLAGGIAHDFNNLLTAIVGNVSLAQQDVAAHSRQAERLSAAERACARAGDLTQQLLTFSKGGAPVRTAARITETILDSAGFALRGSKTRCSSGIPSDLWAVEADIGQLSQVISNLVINADESMPGGGTVTVSARNLPPEVPRPEAAPRGRSVEICVQDQGIGIAPDHLERIFDPYFTTKARGSGLGLTTCYSIVQHHDGLITVDSKPGQGAIFRVYLPASSVEPMDRTRDERTVSGSGRVLVMDDEEMILDVCTEMLEQLGYDVQSASDGAQAVAMYRAALEAGERFDAVILDITVPGGVGGKQALGMLLEIDPATRAIVSSGYSNDPIMADHKAHGFCGVAVKPYDLRGLSHALRAVLAD